VQDHVFENEGNGLSQSKIPCIFCSNVQGHTINCLIYCKI